MLVSWKTLGIRSSCFIDSHEMLSDVSLTAVSLNSRVYGYHTEGLDLNDDSKDFDAGSVRCFEVREHVFGSMYVPCTVCGGVRRAHVVVILVGVEK